MRQLAVLLSLLILPTASFLAISSAHEDGSATTKKQSSPQKQLDIIPLVTLKPGETKEVLFSTQCTVGITRGGGLSLAEMRDGKPFFEKSLLQGNRSYSRQGVTITAPTFDEGTTFAASAEFAALRKLHLDAFRITITAAPDAQPGVLEMHIADNTCAGQCRADFRVLVLEP